MPRPRQGSQHGEREQGRERPKRLHWGRVSGDVGGSVAVIGVQDSKGGFTRAPRSGQGTLRLEFSPA